MKIANIISLFLVIISLIATKTAFAGVVYPVTSTAFKASLDEVAAADIWVGSEDCLLFDEEVVAITQPGHVDGARAFWINLVPIEGTGQSDVVLQPLAGGNEISGSNFRSLGFGADNSMLRSTEFNLGGIIVYAVTMTRNGSPTTVKFTWGTSSSVDGPGNDTDRTQFGADTDGGFTRGYTNPTITFKNGKPVLTVIQDTEAVFQVQWSQDLRNWQTATVSIGWTGGIDQTVLDVTFREMEITPISTTAADLVGKSKAFFRLVSQ